MDITAAVAESKGAPFSITEVDLDELRSDEVRVRMVATGVCHTDLNIRNQLYPTPLPAVLGHEGAGIVEAVGSSVASVRPGDHVLLSANSCGTCRECLSGHPAYCADLFARNFGARRPDGSTAISVDGHPIGSHFFGQSSFATVANVAERSIVVIDPDVDLELVAPLGCGIQTGAGAILTELRPRLGATVVVSGAGAVGGGAIMAARIAGAARIIAVDVNTARLDLAVDLGATHAIEGGEGLTDRILEITGAAGVDVAIDTTGRPDVLRAHADALGIGGRLGLVGAAPSGTEVRFEIGDSLNKGWTFKTIIQGDAVPQVFLPALIGLWREGRFPFERLITRYPFADINTAADDIEHGRAIKPVLVF